MIAYNHYIKFIPELNNDKKVEGSFVDTITIKKSSFSYRNKSLKYGLDYINNQGRDLKFYTDRDFARTVKGQSWAFEVEGVVSFYWKSGTLTLEYLPYENFTEELLEYWCLHIVLPMFFTIEEVYIFLHAGAVEIGNKPILFIAASHGGKSTLTDFFIHQDHTMVSDDKVAIFEKNGDFFSVPSHPHHRPYRKMEDLGFFVNNFSSQPKKIHIIYELVKVEKDDKVSIVELQGFEKFKSLRSVSEINLPFHKKERFEFLMKMAKKIVVYKITVPHDLNRLQEVYNIIIEHS